MSMKTGNRGGFVNGIADVQDVISKIHVLCVSQCRSVSVGNRDPRGTAQHK